MICDIEESFCVAKNAVHVEPVVEERESPSDGSRETREITREKEKESEREREKTCERNGDTGTYPGNIWDKERLLQS